MCVVMCTLKNCGVQARMVFSGGSSVESPTVHISWEMLMLPVLLPRMQITQKAPHEVTYLPLRCRTLLVESKISVHKLVRRQGSLSLWPRWRWWCHQEVVVPSESLLVVSEQGFPNQDLCLLCEHSCFFYPSFQADSFWQVFPVTVQSSWWPSDSWTCSDCWCIQAHLLTGGTPKSAVCEGPGTWLPIGLPLIKAALGGTSRSSDLINENILICV